MEREQASSTDDWTADYSDLAGLLRVKAQAEMVLVIVVDGSRGSGMSVRVRGREVTPGEAGRMLWSLIGGAP